MIPHKVLNIRCYICTYLALFFIFVFIRLLEYQILQFHASRLNKKLPRDWEEHGGFTICISCGIHFLCPVIFLKETSRFIFPYVQLLLLYKMKNHM